MASIQTSPYPLVFRLGNAPALGCTAPASAGVAIRTKSRALEGMQKEAVVCDGSNGRAWRMVSDEGPYLNGTDLAPFPLAFFTAGMAASYLSAIVALLKQRGIAFRSVRFVQHNRYSMTGSAIKGTMTGGALPVQLDLHIDADIGKAALADLAAAAVETSPVTALLRNKLDSEFSLVVGDRQIATARVAALARPIDAHADGFDAAAPSATDFRKDIIEKLESAETLIGVEGGAGSSLTAEQNRILHVCGNCTLRDDGLAEIRTQLLKPIGSVFRFLAAIDAGADDRAPSGLAYLSAGVAFCYMTQLGRYAHIVKKPLGDYRLVQDTCFGESGTSADAEPVRTHVFLAVSDDDYARTLVDMGEQTCFLHAACRGTVPVEITVDTPP
ncbi:MAG TPA: OsmC family protein [Burkholderiales bacterium]|jgi:organic hydroperoxide reductase OsmC/OhrA